MKHQETKAARLKMSEGVFPVHCKLAEFVNAKDMHRLSVGDASIE